MKIKITLAYQGAAFHGWQRQDSLTTVQGTLEEALAVYLQAEAKKANLSLSEPIAIRGSGRTDAGVHARAQVASFVWPEEIPCDCGLLRKALDGITPDSLSVLHAEVCDDSFDARSTPHVKRYSYRIITSNGAPVALVRARALLVHQPLDVASMIHASRHFLGTHDFSSFRASDCGASSTVRRIVLSEFCRSSEGNFLYLVEGKGFLKQMVRTMVGTLLEIGLGKRGPDSIPETLAAKDRTFAGPSAPAHGLCLEQVRY